MVRYALLDSLSPGVGNVFLWPWPYTLTSRFLLFGSTLTVSVVWCLRVFVPAGAGKTHTMMGSVRVVGARADNGSMEVSGIVPQSLVELFRLLEERVEAGSGEGDGVETWAVRVGYLQVRAWGPNIVRRAFCVCGASRCSFSVVSSVVAISRCAVPGI